MHGGGIMRIAVFGGSFNPPHIGHTEAAGKAADALCADRLLIVPAGKPPHKEQEAFWPDAQARYDLAALAFAPCAKAQLCALEMHRPGPSYTVDTLAQLHAQFPDAELFLMMGADMFLSFESWKDFRDIFALACLAVFSRGEGGDEAINGLAERFRRDYGARVRVLDFAPLALSSTQLREKLGNREGNNLVAPSVYEEIIRHRYYGAKPNLAWLREKSYAYLDEKRIPHVMGCEQAAVRLAERWGADTGLAAEAGILHDITKKIKGAEQLILCEKYGIITDNDEKENYKLLHSKTGAAFAREQFGITDEVYNAIFWHTTGRENMTLLEKIIYIADYIEPNRSFDGLDELRRLADENLDAAVVKGLRMSLEELSARGAKPHDNSLKALSCLETN